MKLKNLGEVEQRHLLELAIQCEAPRMKVLLNLEASTSGQLYNSGKYKPHLLTAAEYGRSNAVQDLLDLGLIRDVNSTHSRTRETALHLTVECNSLKSINFLLKFSADVNQRDAKERSALLLATRFDYEGCLLILLKQGADIALSDNQGQTV